MAEKNGKVFKAALVAIPLLILGTATTAAQVWRNGEKLTSQSDMISRISQTNDTIATAMDNLTDRVIGNSQAIAVVQGNRFTADDGLAVWQEIGSIREEIASMPHEEAAEWLIDRFDRLELKVDRIDQQLHVALNGP